jgi:hypothetical protein
MDFIGDMSDSFLEKVFHDHVESEVFEEICNEYESFVEDGSNKSRTFAFWSYSTVQDILTDYPYLISIYRQVQDVVTTISQMVNLFEVEQEELTSLASGVDLETIVAGQLLGAEKLGKEQFAEFSREKLFSDEPDIFEKLERNKLQTFSTSKKTVGKDNKGKEINAKLNRNFLLGFWSLQKVVKFI